MNTKIPFYVFFSIGSICGIAALLLFTLRIPVAEIISVDNVDYIYDKLSFHMFFLEATFVIGGLAAAVIGFVGYQSIKDEAVNKAVAKAKDEAGAYFQTLHESAESDIQIESSDNGSKQPEMKTRLDEEESK